MNSGLRQESEGGVTFTGIRNLVEPHGNSTPGPNSAAIELELKLILASPSFHASKRSQQFLTYVVQFRLDGHEEALKERTIGAMLYKRPADYATGDDSVVRVQAGEVRRRLEQYYKSPPPESTVHIELPLGSYAPEIRWITPPAHPAPAHDATASETAENPVSVATARREAASRRKPRLLAIGLACVLALGLAVFAGYNIYKQKTQNVLSRFWGPVFGSSSPALICLPKPIFYRPTTALYKKSGKWPGEFDNEVDRENSRPNLQPNDQILWGDLTEWNDFGVSKDDVKAAFRLSNLLIKMGKPTELKIGNDYGWDDLRHAPAVIVGAFSNYSTIRITSGLHFMFSDKSEPFCIREQGGAKRAWYVVSDPYTTVVSTDYGLVTRLVNSSTGQFVVSVAGLTAPGSEAAAEMAGSSDDLTRALHDAPPDWSRKNLQIVVKTTVNDGVAGPPQVVAVYVW